MAHNTRGANALNQSYWLTLSTVDDLTLQTHQRASAVRKFEYNIIDHVHGGVEEYKYELLAKEEVMAMSDREVLDWWQTEEHQSVINNLLEVLQ